MGHFISVDKKPQYRTVEGCKKEMRKKAPTLGMEDLIDYDDITCDCCGKKAPYLAAAFIRVEDDTPTVDIPSMGDNKGTKVDLCADCFYYGVRPRVVRFGKIKWNQEGDKIKQRANTATGSVW